MPFNLSTRWLTAFILLFSLSSSTSCCALATPGRVSVTTSRGVVDGYSGVTSNRFVLPYAQSPTASRRFREPVAVGSLAAYDASGLQSACPQDLGAIVSTREDCLFISIYTPKGVTKTSNLPVFVWVHGGSFIAGGTTGTGLDGSALAVRENMIVVTVQYRLGVLGFLKIESLGLTGNYGFKDVIMALTFIKKEIVAFGGSSKVTLAGHSSGAEMIKALLVTPSAVSLFSRAILHSAPLNYADQSPSIANAIGTSILGPGGLNCTNLGCLQRQPVQNILDAQFSLFDPSTSIYAGYVQGASTVTPIRTVVDGSLVTRAFGAVTQEQGAIEGVGKQIIFTTMKDEACDAIGQLMPNVLPAQYFPSIVTQLFGPRAEPILWSRLYPLGTGPDATREALVQLSTDYGWTCANQQSAVNISQNAIAEPIVYLAQFSIGISYSNSSVPSCVGEASHQDDIYTVFGTSSARLSRSQTIVMNEVMDRWGAFARTGSPNSGSLSVWPPLESGSNLNILVFGGSTARSVLTSAQRAKQCAIGKGLWGGRVPFDEQLLL